MAKHEAMIELSESMLSRCRETAFLLASKAGFGEGDAWDVALAVFEACANAVTHGEAKQGGIGTLRISTSRGRFKAVVEDPGCGFLAPGHSALPPATSNRGRGVPLMHVFMDEVRFESNGGCRVILVKRLRSKMTSRTRS